MMWGRADPAASGLATGESPGAPAPLIALELNELCPALLDKWMQAGLLPNFAKLHARSDVFVTKADVEEPALLEPWIQWYSVHTGLAYDQHKVFHLTEGARAGHADIYRMLLAAGRTVASFASMNVAPFASEGSTYLGDPWSDDGNAFPPEFDVYNRFVAMNVREYSNASRRMGLADYAGFVSFMARHGLSADTVAKIVAQLGEEKLSPRELSWRRVFVLDRLQFDLFRSTWRKTRPAFASFFANSVAHLQHSYWRHMEPEAFKIQPGPDEMASYGDAIRDAYVALDGVVGKFIALAEAEGARLMFLTALSQQPFLRYEDLGGQHFHRLHDVEKFLDQMGVARLDVSPTMTHQYLVRFASAEEMQTARTRLAALRLEDGRELFGFPAIDTAPTSLYFGCQIATVTPTDTPVIDGQSNRQLRFADLFYRIEAIKSGRHHPDGCLWIESGRHKRHSEKVSVLDVLPTQLDMLGVERPLGNFRGRSLVPQMAG
jgi:hypothetical protein